jgi:hypothetical protein
MADTWCTSKSHAPIGSYLRLLSLSRTCHEPMTHTHVYSRLWSLGRCSQVMYRTNHIKWLASPRAQILFSLTYLLKSWCSTSSQRKWERLARERVTGSTSSYLTRASTLQGIVAFGFLYYIPVFTIFMLYLCPKVHLLLSSSHKPEQ